jgi:probable HAF family extracellular repeat protein
LLLYSAQWAAGAAARFVAAALGHIAAHIVSAQRFDPLVPTSAGAEEKLLSGMMYLATPLGAARYHCAIAGINNNTRVVGRSCDQNGNCRAFFWEKNVMSDLNDLIPADSPLY